MNAVIAITLFGFGLFFVLVGAASLSNIDKGLSYVGIGFFFLVGCFLTVYFKVM